MLLDRRALNFGKSNQLNILLSKLKSKLKVFVGTAYIDFKFLTAHTSSWFL